MATKEDILEQIVEEYLLHRGYFVRHNVKFRPDKDHPDFISKQDSNHSDIDVIGYHPERSGTEKIWVVSCKSWQAGFKPVSLLDAISNDKKVSGRPAWKSFRELTCPKWSQAFLKAIKDETGEDCFTYVTAVTRLENEEDDKSRWENHLPFRRAIGENPIRILTLVEMACEIQKRLSTTLAATEVGRMLQLFSAAGIDIRQLAAIPLDYRK